MQAVLFNGFHTYEEKTLINKIQTFSQSIIFSQIKKTFNKIWHNKKGFKSIILS